MLTYDLTHHLMIELDTIITLATITCIVKKVKKCMNNI
jgi:hypothetical protein